ncbi:MAG: alcohol dehydrogenase catalytic domain-containing protein [Armatimonadota bacterium]|nr:alcohol dehydrogenase catalytic domain-containing protein [bacterium]
MSDIMQSYKRVAHKLPDTIYTWHLYGAGVENLGRDGKPETKPLPIYGPDQLLLRIDAVGICFSDIKVINQGNQHPRVIGRDLTVDPVTLGHEAAVTVAGVGDSLKGKFSIGQRFIVQADVFVNGKSMAFGYALPGAQTQYQVVGQEVLAGDEGCYLLPVQNTTGYAEAALAEPWACVVASYRINRRTSIKPGGVMWIVNAGGEGDFTFGMNIDSKTVIASGVTGKLADELKTLAGQGKFDLVTSAGAGDIDALSAKYGLFDDVVILGSDADVVEKAAECLGRDAVLSILSNGNMTRPIKVDIGKIHYQNHSYLGATTGKLADAYGPTRVPSELKQGGSAWFIGAGGPMGQMHLQRAVELPNGPMKILATDVDTARLESVKQRFMPIAERRGVDLRVVNPMEISPEEFNKLLEEFTGGKGFDDIVALAPVAKLVEQAVPWMGEQCLMNIFAGVPTGTIASLDLTGVYAKGVRFVGSSGSKVTDMQDTLGAAESGELSTNTSVAAVGGIEASWDGMKAVKEGKFPGRVVIYPQISGLALTAVPEIGKVLPSVAAKLTDGMFWNREAEAELLRTMLKLEIIGEE